MEFSQEAPTQGFSTNSAQDFIIRVENRFHQFRLVALLSNHPDCAVSGPDLLDPVVLQKLLELPVGSRGEVLHDGDALATRLGGRGVIALALEHAHTVVGGEELDDNRGGGLVRSRRELASSVALHNGCAHLGKGGNFTLGFRSREQRL